MNIYIYIYINEIFKCAYLKQRNGAEKIGKSAIFALISKQACTFLFLICIFEISAHT